MDKPNLERKTQKAPVLYLGGASIALAVTALAYAGVVASDFTTTNFPLASYVLIPALVLGAMGLIDDLRGLPALPRLIVQTAIAIAVSLVLTNSKNSRCAFCIFSRDNLGYCSNLVSTNSVQGLENPQEFVYLKTTRTSK